MKLKELLKELKETQDKIKKIEADENFFDWKSTMEDYSKLVRETEAMGVSTDCVEIAIEVYSNDETNFEYADAYAKLSSKLKELKEELFEYNLEDLED